MSETTQVQNQKTTQNEVSQLKAELKKYKKIADTFEQWQTILGEICIVSTTDPKGNITYINKLFEKVSQYSFSELEGKNHRILKSGIHSDAFYKKIYDEVNAGRVFVGDVKNRCKDGSFYWVKAAIGAVKNEDGSVRELVGIRAHTTEQMDLQESLEAERAEMEKKIEEQTSEIQQKLEDQQALGEELASMQEQITNEDRAAKASSKMDEIGAAAEQSGNAIKGLAETTQKISGVLEVIRKIADQTNLLALNAAIEAARAGDAGRGFAVVADEVRRLAEGSSKAAGEIDATVNQIKSDAQNTAEKIEEGTVEVTEGKKIVDEALTSLTDMVEMVQKVVAKQSFAEQK
ncbi:methyl-accepting chemotaxis protein [Nitrosopumilus sp. Nsub]|uniref:methyl-accepting chemotaxis protein n=1 Tax=Nitrosopumilus sp. Nsub TaxID=1776294 RepID=UPI00155E7B53|nr:methyl-accepting chemotaxis protein [Nitrosopumilus sp. Nsub]